MICCLRIDILLRIEEKKLHNFLLAISINDVFFTYCFIMTAFVTDCVGEIWRCIDGINGNDPIWAKKNLKKKKNGRDFYDERERMFHNG